MKLKKCRKSSGGNVKGMVGMGGGFGEEWYRSRDSRKYVEGRRGC